MNTIPKPLAKSKDTVTLSRKDWDRVIEALEDVQDRKTVDAFAANPGKKDGIPSGFMKRILAGENPVRVYREARAMSATALAAATGLPQSYISNIETGKKPGSSAAMKKIAAALHVDMEDLVG